MLIYAVRVEKQLSPKYLSCLKGYLSEGEQEKINRFRKWQDAQRSLVGRILMRCLVLHYSPVAIEHITFGTNEYGKPYLKGFSDLCFNISHSGQWVVGAIDKGKVGIDIEEINEIDLKIADRFFSSAECRQLYSQPANQRLSYFFDLWTLKESYIKAVGQGLSLGLGSFTIIKGKDDITLSPPVEPHFFKQYEGFDGYKLSVCSKNNHFPAEVQIFQLDEFFSFSIKTLGS